MKITPLEIRQKTFEKAFRGLDKDEVHAYLASLSQEWEKSLDETKELRIKLDASEREVEKLREVESSLFKTLKTAEDTGANMIDQATKTAELHMRETQIRAEAIMNDAKAKAKSTLEEAEIRARQAMEEMEERIKGLVQTYKTLENYRDDLLSEIRAVAQDAMEKADRVKSQIKHFDPEEYVFKTKSMVANYKMPKLEQETTPEPEPATIQKPAYIPEKENKAVNVESTKPKKNKSTSFFDEIE